jgi:hypothetical protein
MKSRTDALRRRLARLCKDAGVLGVVPHSMRGLHSTIAVERCATGRIVATALGHTSFERITVPHYLAPGTVERARRSESRRCSGQPSGEVPSKLTSPPPANTTDPTNTEHKNIREIA